MSRGEGVGLRVRGVLMVRTHPFSWTLAHKLNERALEGKSIVRMYM